MNICLSSITGVASDASLTSLPEAVEDLGGEEVITLSPSLSEEIPFTLPTVVDSDFPICATIISEEEAQMSVALTEYFQDQRKVYEQVSAVFPGYHVCT